jgi:myb proto-oncogene protein
LPGKWTDEEDEKLLRIVKEVGLRNYCWPKIGDYFSKRTGKQCRERWYNHLDPAVAKGDWTKEVNLYHPNLCFFLNYVAHSLRFFYCI